MGKSFRVPDIGFSSGLGKCSVCMQSAFVAALIAWTIAGFVFFATTNIWLLSGAFALAAAATLLVLMHVSAFALRMTRATLPKIAGAGAAGMDRRAFGKRLTRMFIFGALVTMAPWSLAKAQGCNCYSDNDCSCPSDFPQCVFNPGTGEAICCGPNNNGCAGPTQTWCCPPGSSCSGQEGYCYAPQ